MSLVQAEVSLSLEATEDGSGPASYRELIEFLDPMDTSSLDPQVASVLDNYYSYNYTNQDEWKQIQSIRYEGVLNIKGEAYPYIAFKKKPDFCKAVFFSKGRPFMVMSYDGKDAWQMSESQEPTIMSREEAQNFIRDATIGGRLLYPHLPGKNVELMGSKVINGRRCFELIVTMPDGQKIITMIGMLDFRLHQQIVTNAANGKREVTTHYDFMNHPSGVRLPSRSELSVDGELVHTLELNAVQFNLGVTSWMFASSSGAQLPRADLKPFDAEALIDVPVDLSVQADVGLDGHSPFTETSPFEQETQQVIDSAADWKQQFPFLDLENSAEIE